MTPALVYLLIAFLLASIFAYTSLMDLHWISLPIEFCKTLMGAVIVATPLLPIAIKLLAAGYLAVSILMTLSFLSKYRPVSRT